MNRKRKLGHKVQARSGKMICSAAQKFRDLIYDVFDGKLHKNISSVPIIKIYDLLQSIDFLEYEVVPDSELNGQLAVTYPDKDKRLIKITDTVFDGACDGKGFHRFTLAHEIGHLLLHVNETPKAYARGEEPNHKIYQDSEWQADEFASEFLMDSREITGKESSVDLSLKYDVSGLAAETKLRKIKK